MIRLTSGYYVLVNVFSRGLTLMLKACYISQLANINVIHLLSPYTFRLKTVLCKIAVSLSDNVYQRSLVIKSLTTVQVHEGTILLRFYIFYVCGRIRFYLVNAVLRFVFSWQSMMTTACRVVLESWIRAPPSVHTAVLHDNTGFY